MAYSRFWDSDIYIYPHVEGHICCAACWLSEEAKSEIIDNTKINGVVVLNADDNFYTLHKNSNPSLQFLL